MQTDELPPELLVPPKRLGTLLAQARLAGGFSLAEASDALGEQFSSLELLEVETGRRPVLDPDLVTLTELYGIDTTDLIPDRSQLIIDLDEGVLGVGERQVRLGVETPERDDVLAQYLAMVYAMRDLRPGTKVPLRTPDMDVLATALSTPAEQLEDELRRMMADAGVVGGRVDAPPIVDCAEPHRYEVYARQDLEPPDDTWPGEELLDANARRLCGLAIREATGEPIEALPGGVTMVYIAPTEDSWRDGDREVECLFRHDEPTTATLRRGDA